MICGVGINDMPRGWRKECKWNQLVYKKWHSMFIRCYSEKAQERNPTYKGCVVNSRWVCLSNFVEDFPKIDGYNEEKLLNGELELDKDIKSDGKNKEYSLENCMLVSRYENVKQSHKTRDYVCFQGENHPMYGKHYTHSEETKQKISNANKGKHRSEKTKRKMSEARSGENNPRARKVNQFDKNGTFIKTWNCMRDAERELGVCTGAISACCRGRSETAGGYIWKYVEEEE